MADYSRICDSNNQLTPRSICSFGPTAISLPSSPASRFAPPNETVAPYITNDTKHDEPRSHFDTITIS